MTTRFMDICEGGSVELAQVIYQEALEQSIPGDCLVQLGLISACQHGNLQIVQWLAELQSVNFFEGKANLFELVCAQDHLSLAQWIWEQTSGPHHQPNLQAALISAHQRRSPIMIPWLTSQVLP